MKKRILKFIKEAFDNRYVKFFSYLLLAVVVFALHLIFQGEDVSFLAVIRKIFDMIRSEDTLTVLLAALISLLFARTLRVCDKYLEESYKINDDHHAIITEYDGHKKEYAKSDENIVDKEFEQMAETLRQYGEVEIVGLEDFSLKGCDIFIGKKLSEEILETADCLKAVFAYKTGVDDFPLSALKQRNVILVNSHVDAKYIAEYAFGLSISLVNRITECDKKLRQGIWYDVENPYWKSIFELKIGLLGYGHIGKEIHKILARNNIEVYTIDRGKKYENIHLVKSLEELCEKTTLIIASLPKTPDTNLLFNEEIFKLLKDKYIVNVGRSNCIDQKALYYALKSNMLAGAAIDTWDKKPKNPYESLLPSKYPLVDLENIVLSPHQAMRIEVGHARYVQDITSKVIEFISGNLPQDIVNLDRGY